ncbi:MAG: flagellar basal-body rod protein FlgF [Alphaproteobacteria bacterium]
MSTASHIAMSHQMALQNQMDIIANNIANSSTAGFQGQNSMFAAVLSKATTGDQVAFVEDRGVLRNIESGPLSSTSNPLDIAIKGEGYFVIETEEGPRYSRNGAFRVDADGQLVNVDGDPILSEDNLPIVFAPGETDIQVSRDGSVSTENGVISRLRLVTFANEQDMSKAGNNLYETEQEPLEAPDSEFVQGMLEGSNVKAVVELTRMIQVMRSYQGAAKLIESEDERNKRAIQTLTKAV